MDNSILKKKLSTFRTPKGKLTRVADDVLIEVIKAWEKWPGSSSEMARELGLTMRRTSSFCPVRQGWRKPGIG